MELAQNANPNLMPISGISSDALLWIVLIIAAVVVAYILLSGYSRDSYRGSKGGRVKRIIEYDDEQEEIV